MHLAQSIALRIVTKTNDSFERVRWAAKIMSPAGFTHETPGKDVLVGGPLGLSTGEPVNAIRSQLAASQEPVSSSILFENMGYDWKILRRIATVQY